MIVSPQWRYKPSDLGIYLEHDKSENTSQWHFFTFFRMVQKYRCVVEAVLEVIAFCTIQGFDTISFKPSNLGIYLEHDKSENTSQ